MGVNRAQLEARERKLKAEAGETTPLVWAAFYMRPPDTPVCLALAKAPPTR